jgi:hypothetical protein
MPQIENVTQNIMRTLEGGRLNGVKYESETSGNAGVSFQVSKSCEKRKLVYTRRAYPASGLHIRSAAASRESPQQEDMEFALRETPKLNALKRVEPALSRFATR